MKTVEEGYELFKRARNNKNYFNYFWTDYVCMCLFEDYDEGYRGCSERHTVRTMMSYDDLEKVESFEDFEALIARLKLELHV